MRLRNLSIFSRLLFSIVGAGLLVAIISGVAHYLFASRLIQESVKNQMETALQGSLAHFDKTYTLPVSGDLRVLESSPVVDDLLMSFGADVYLNKPTAERLFLSVAKSRPSLYSSIRLISANGQEQIIVSGGKRKRNYQSILQPIDNNFEQKLARLFTRLSKAKPRQILFEGPLTHGDKTFSFLAGISKREPEIGGFGGAVVAHVNLTEYLTYLSNFQIFEQSMTWAFDQTGTRILAPPREQVAFDPGSYLFSRKPVPKGAILFASGRGPKWTDEQTSSNMSDLLRIAFSMSPKQFSTQLRGAGLITILVVLAIVLVATIIALFVARQLSLPIRALSQMTASVAQGNLEARVSEDWSGELGQLGVAFNHMVHTLRDTTFSKAYVDNIIQSMTDTLVVVNQDGTIGEANQALLDLLGYEEHEILGKHDLLGAPFHKILGDVSVQQKILAALETNGFITDIETTYLAKDGSEIPVSLSSSIVRGHDGHNSGFVCVAQDITERKRAEAERDKLHRQLVDASRQAGQAEVATGVLHNVGNVLNSVNVSATLVADKIRESKVTNLTKASQLLHAHVDDLATFMTQDKKGKQLPSYLVTLARHLESEQQTILSEFQSITENISHIKQIVGRQQSYASNAGVTQSVVLADLIDDALSMNVSERHKIEVVREYDDIPVITVDKHKLLQIVVNLVCNAKQAINEHRADDKRIVLRIKRVGPERVRVEVTDNGVGIEEDNLARLFEYGFTTKEEGHGFGLHVSANTAKELGGSLMCHSDGPGKGAVFTLELPFAVTEQAA